MQKLIKKTLLATILSSAALCGSAQADVYFELGLSSVSDKVEGESISHMGALAVVGTTLSSAETFSHKVEGIALVGLNSDKVEGFDVKVQTLIGAAYRPTFKVSESVDLYARLGVFNGKAKASGFGVSESESSTDAGFGVGIDFSAVSLSYLNVDGVNFINATYRF